MTARAHRSLICTGIVAVLLSLAAVEWWRASAPLSALADDDSADDDSSDDDDSGTFDYLTSPPKE